MPETYDDFDIEDSERSPTWPDGSGSGGPLDGVRVIELGTVVSGPFAGRLLADQGADVIKVEAPDRPDPMRNWASTPIGATGCGGRSTRATSAA